MRFRLYAAKSGVSFRASLSRVFYAFGYGLMSAAVMVLAFSPVAYGGNDLIVDPSASAANQAAIWKANNGRDVVDIANPNQGVSHNKFQSYSISSDGVILNNATSDQDSKTGGRIRKNAKLTSSAHTIINEVTGSDDTELKGHTEVVGSKAKVIIANPNGVSCDGCSFENVSNATLSTGGVQIGSDGKVKLKVDRGWVKVGRQGMKGADKADLVGRHILVDGKVEASGEIVASGGAQIYDADQGLALFNPTTQAKQTLYAVDATEFGAMNGGQIRILGNETGLGVRHLGGLSAQDGKVSINSRGDSRLGKIKAKTGVEIRSADQIIQVDDWTSDLGDILISTDKGLESFRGRKIKTSGNINIIGKTDLKLSGEIEGQDINILTSGSLFNSGYIMGEGLVNVLSDNDINNAREKKEAYNLNINKFDSSWVPYFQIRANQPLVWWGCSWWGCRYNNAGDINYARWWLQTYDAKAFEEDVLINGATMIGGDLSLKAGLNVNNNAGLILAKNNLNIEATKGSFVNSYISTRDRVNVNEGCKVGDCGFRTTFNAGEVYAGKDLKIKAGLDIENTASWVAAAGDVFLKSGRDITNHLMKSKFLTSDYNEWGQGVYFFRDSTSEEHVVMAPGYMGSYGGSLYADAGRNISVLGSDLESKNNLSLYALGDISLQDSVQNASQSTWRSAWGWWRSGWRRKYQWNYAGSWAVNEDRSETATADVIAKDIYVQGKNVSSQNARLIAENSLNIKGEKIILQGKGTSQAKDADDQSPFSSYKDQEIKEMTETFNGSNFLLESMQENKQLYLVSKLKEISMDDLKKEARSVGVQEFKEYKSIIDGKFYVDVNSLKKGETSFVAAILNNKLPQDSVLDASEIARNKEYMTNMGWRLAVGDTLGDLEKDHKTYGHAGTDLNIQSDSDFYVTGGTALTANQDLTIKSKGSIRIIGAENVNIDAWEKSLQPITQIERSGYAGLLNPTYKAYYELPKLGAVSLVAGRDLILSADKNIQNYAGSILSTGNVVLSAGKNVENHAARNYFVLTGEHGCLGAACGRLGHDYVAGEILSGSDLIVSAGGDVINRGSNMAAAGNILIAADGDIGNESVSSRYVLQDYEKSKKLFGKKTKKTVIYNEDAVMQEANMSSENGSIILKAKEDITNVGGILSAAGDIDLSADKDILLDGKVEETYHIFKKRGFKGFSYGQDNTYWNNNKIALSWLEANNIKLNAGNDLTGIGAQLMASHDIDVSAGEDVSFDALQTNKYIRKSGWSVGISFPGSSIVEAIIAGDEKLAFKNFINSNPLLGAVDKLSRAKNTSDFINGGAALVYRAAETANRINGNNTTANSFSDAFVKTFNPFDGLDLAAGLPGMKLDPATGKSTFDWKSLINITFRFGAYKSAQKWTESHVSKLMAGNDLSIDAGDNLNLVGGTIASAGHDAVLLAGNDLNISALADNFTSKNSNWGGNFGFTLSSITVGANGSKAGSNSTLFSNAAITAGNNLTAISGRDLNIVGGNLKADTIDLDVGRNLRLQSKQNTSSSYERGFDGSITVGGPEGVGATVGGVYGKGEREYTDTPSSIISEKDLNIYVGENTYLLGSVMNSKNGKLSLDTGNLYFDNLHDRDVYKRIEAHVNTAGISSGAVGNQAIGTILKNSDAWGSYYYKNKKGISYATIGEGEIKVRNNPSLQLTALNRDVNNLQITTKDKEINIEIPGINLYKLKEGIKNATNIYRAATQADDILRDNGKTADSVNVEMVRDLIMSGRSNEQIRSFIASPTYAASYKYRDILENGKKHGKSQAEINQAIMYASIGEKVFFDPKDKAYKINTNCDENGPAPCTIPLKDLRAMPKDKVLQLVSDAASLLGYVTTQGKNDQLIEQARFSVGNAVMCMVTWAIDRKDISIMDEAFNRFGAPVIYGLAKDYGLDVNKLQLYYDTIKAKNNPQALDDMRSWYDFSKKDEMLAELKNAAERKASDAEINQIIEKYSGYLKSAPPFYRTQGFENAVKEVTIRGSGALMTVAGYANSFIGAGIIVGSEGLAAAPGYALYAYGADVSAAGLQTLFSGEWYSTLTYRGFVNILKASGMDEASAAKSAGWAEILLGAGLSGASLVQMSQKLSQQYGGNYQAGLKDFIKGSVGIVDDQTAKLMASHAQTVLGKIDDVSGVYEFTVNGGKYVGQSKNIPQRLVQHIGKNGKFSGQQLQNQISKAMPGSTKLEREVYESYLYKTNKRSEILIANSRDPMGGRTELYQSMLAEVIKKYNLPK